MPNWWLVQCFAPERVRSLAQRREEKARLQHSVSNSGDCQFIPADLQSFGMKAIAACLILGMRRFQQALKEEIGADRSLGFPKYFLMQNFKTLIPSLGSTNLSTTGFGEKQHKHIKRHMSKSNKRPGQGVITGQVCSSCVCTPKFNHGHHFSILVKALPLPGGNDGGIDDQKP